MEALSQTTEPLKPGTETAADALFGDSESFAEGFDAESLFRRLLPDGNLLNIGDGFLGEHLKLHVIATTNAPVRQLDPALLRPGRLMGTREFRRLTRPEAQRLAEAKGLPGCTSAQILPEGGRAMAD